jgi:hypothetical protein
MLVGRLACSEPLNLRRNHPPFEHGAPVWTVVPGVVSAAPKLTAKAVLSAVFSAYLFVQDRSLDGNTPILSHRLPARHILRLAFKLL